ncbi:nitrogen fixation protein FixH [Ahrensia sp. R2A130]|nr:nitrogen fixation protein FixH [Ahrensia sp. R2A130]
MASDTHTRPRFTGWHMFATLAAFFGTIIAVNITMAVFAVGSWTGLVVKNSYVASQHFNAQLTDAKLQADTGIRSQLTFADGNVSIAIEDAGGDAVMPKKLVLWLGRPVFEQQDRTVEAACAPTGVCTAPAQLAAGLWALRVEAVTAAGSYRRDARLLVKDDGSVRVE